MNKSEFDNILGFGYLIYAIYFILNLVYLSKFEEISILYNIDYLSNMSIYGDMIAFSCMSLFMIYFLYSSSKRKKEKLIISQEKEKEVNNKMLKYKIFILINLTVGIFFIVKVKDMNITFINLVLIFSSILIYDAKEGYIKSYMNNRYLDWLSKISIEEESMNVDSKKWRYNIWYDERENVDFSVRRQILWKSSISLIFNLIFYIAFIDTVFKYFHVFYIIKNLLLMIESVFNLYTSFTGKCSGIRIENTSEHEFKKEVVITNYKLKREIKFYVYENYDIREMENINICHSIITKDVTRIENISLYNLRDERNNRSKKTSIVIAMLLFIFVVYTKQDSEYLYINENTEKEYGYENMSVDHDKKLEIDDFKIDDMIEIDKEYSKDNLHINIDKLYINEKDAKLVIQILNNNPDKGMVLNTSDNIYVYNSSNYPDSNILTWEHNYNLEIDIVDIPKNTNNVYVDLEYTLSPYIMSEYLDYNYKNIYPLNVVDNYVVLNIDLNKNQVSLKFLGYDEFYNISDNILEFN